MEDPEVYHNNLHIEIARCQDFSDWIYHDVRFDCDGEAVGRTGERLGQIREQIGIQALYGIAAGWAIRTAQRVTAAYIRMGKEPAPITAMLDGKQEMKDVQQRNYVSAVQFISAVAVDDLEMGEAIFNAVAEATDDDLQTFMYLIIMICVQISSLAKASGRLQP